MSEGFFSRWSQRKLETREAATAPVAAPVEASPPAAVVQVAAPLPSSLPSVASVPPVPSAPSAPEAPPPLTLDDVATLTPASDFAPFVARGTSAEVKNAALKKLFTDPHYNVMDGLDTYIGDYNTPDPLPEGMLRQMVQSQLLGLFADEAQPPQPPPPASLAAPHEDPDLQLQPDPAAGPAIPDAGAGEDPASQH